MFLSLSKRRRFIVTCFFLSLGFFSIQLLEESYRFMAIGGLSLLTLALFIWSLYEGLGLDLTILSLVLPFLFTIGVGLFWFLLPASIFTRIPVVIFYGFGIYALCLTMNIYTVSTIRTIALLRAARGVGFVLTMVTAFLLYDAIVSLRVSLPLTSIFVFIISLPLFLQGYWSIPLTINFSKSLARMTFISSLVVAEISTILYFWPVTVVVGSLFLTLAIYVILGLGQARLEARLFRSIVREYLFVGTLVFIGMFLATNWGGY